MLVLGIETSTVRSSVALVDAERVIASASLGVDRRHGEFVAPAIDFCLRQAGMTPDKLTGVAVGLGPGLYTGLRVGIATAQTMAMSCGVPTVGISGLDVLAFQARHTKGLICTVIDAKRRELFWAFYRPSPGGVQREGELQVGTLDALEAEIAATGESVLIVGDGGWLHRDRLEVLDATLAGPEAACPDAAVLAELAVPKFVREETVRPRQLQPIYLRGADAKIGWATRGRLRGGAPA
ncbi:MAG: tRNA (adenosine(37)-N6)-threonylcarbamoyltransferase complex dimerization subunit type 1 TsaB [Nitriliruptoraceae bacterium]